MKKIWIYLFVLPMIVSGQSRIIYPIGPTVVQPIDDLAYLIGAGKLEGFSFIEKFGKNPSIATATQETIWDGSNMYTYLDTANFLRIASTDANDDTSDTGARTIILFGLDSLYNLRNETLTLGGTDSITSTLTYLRVYRAYVATSGSSATNEGDIQFIAKGTTTLLMQITANEGQTLMAVYTIPNGYTGYLVDYDASILRQTGTTATAADVDVYRRPYGGTWRSTKPHGIMNTGNTAIDYEFPFWLILQEKTDVEVRATPTAAVSITGGFTILLEKN